MTIDGIWFSIIPTILFILFLLIGILFGMIRGFRKSLILAIQACVIFIGCLIAYLIIVNNPNTDTRIVSIINNFMGENGLQNSFGVSSDCNSFKEILIQYIPKQMNMGDGIALILKDNGAYLVSIVNLVYHIVFALLFFIAYLLLVFIFYIVYLIAYPERRHKEKIIKKNLETDPNKKYKPHRGFGAVVGGIRGFVSGFILVSLVGSIFYIAGGTGEKEYESYDWGDESLNQGYSVYQALGSYGNTGIFKVLNNIKNKDNVPFYFFAANLVFSGNDVENNSNNLVLTRDLGELSIFSRNTFDLLVKYGRDDLKEAMKNPGENNSNLNNTITKIYKNPEFQNEFNALIDNFNTNTYFINMTFSVVDSFASHLDQININDDSNKDAYELLNVLFNSNYKSDYIPEDKDSDVVSTLKPSMLLNKEDVKATFNLIFDLLSQETTNDSVYDSVNLTTVALENIKDLSVLNTDNKSQLNPVFERLYTYLSNKYLTNDNTNDTTLLSTSYLLEDTNSESIDWIDELNNAISAISSSLKLFKSVYVPGSSDSIPVQIVTSLYNIFDTSNDKYTENNELYGSIVDRLANSKLLGKVFATNYITSSVINFLNSISNNANVYVPKKINYCNTESDGKIVYGEIYNLFKGIESILKNKESKNVVLKLVDSQSLENNDIKTLCTSLLSNDELTLNYLLDSQIVSSALSAVVFGLKIDNGFSLVFPNSSKKIIDGKTVNLIDSNEVKRVIRIIPSLVDNVLNTDDSTKGILSFATNNKENIAKSNILCATVANYLIHNLPENISDVLVINDTLKKDDIINNLDCSNENSLWPKEISSILEIFDSVIDIDNVDLNDSKALESALLNEIKNLNKPNKNDNNLTNLDVIYKSSILKDSLSKQLDSKLTSDIVDEETKKLVKTDGIYNKAELSHLVDVINEMDIDLNNTSEINTIVINEVKNLNKASTTNPTKTKLDVMYSSTLITSALSKQLDSKLTSDIVDEETKKLVKTDGIYNKDELSHLVDVINEMNIDLNNNDLSSKISSQISKLNNKTEIVEPDTSKTKLDILYLSTIVKSVITKEIKKEKDNIILPDDALDGSYIRKDEIKALIDVISPYANPDGSIDYSSIKDKLRISENDFNETNGKYIKSKILHATISKYLADELNKDKTIVFSSSYTDSSLTYIKPIELQALVNAVCAINNSKDVGMNITVDTTSKINKETLKTNISNSLIVRALVSDTISDSIEKDIKEIYDELTISNGTKVIKSEELNSLVDVLALNSIDNTITLNANIDINSYTIVKNDIATLRNSKIVSYKLTKEIENMGICGDDKKLPAASYSKEDGYISEDELNYLFDIVSIDNKLSIAKLKNSTYTSIDKNKIEPFKNSTIVRYKISSFLPGNDIVIPDEVYETDSNNKKLIISDEYQKLIDALVSLGLTDSTSFDISNIDNNFDDIKATKVANSIILRATITEKLEITNEEISLYYFSGDIDSTKTVNGKQILILTNDEVKNILIGITSMGIENGVSISISIDTIKKYTEDTLTTVLKSNTLRYILSQVVSTVSTTAPTNNEYVYLKNNNKLDYISFYTSDEIKSEVKNLQK